MSYYSISILMNTDITCSKYALLMHKNNLISAQIYCRRENLGNYLPLSHFIIHCVVLF